MEHFPDGSIEKIVAGFEAAMSRLLPVDQKIAQTLADVGFVHHLPRKEVTELLVIRDAIKKVQDLRMARYLREPHR